MNPVATSMSQYISWIMIAMYVKPKVNIIGVCTLLGEYTECGDFDTR